MKVRFTYPAQHDLRKVYAYVSQDNPDAASRIVTRLMERCWSLGDDPYKGRKTNEPGALLLVIPRFKYFIFYSITGTEVHILRIRHTARKRLPRWDVK